ncbi:hypothetical protein ACXR2U_13125 [Jatrophihabitans sp. YIM 134969]
MEAVEHDVSQYFQTAKVNCGYTALAMQLSYHGSVLTPEDISRSAPRAVVDGVELPGSLATQLATWAVGQGFRAHLTTFDFLIVDLSWASLDRASLISRLTAVRDTRDVPSLGPALSRAYVDAYVQYLDAGGELSIAPHVSAGSLYEKLRRGPLGVSVCTAPLYGHGRMSEALPGREVADDVHGTIGTHSVVIIGNTTSGDFRLADPWRGRTQVSADALICAMAAAEIECDALCIEFDRR